MPETASLPPLGRAETIDASVRSRWPRPAPAVRRTLVARRHGRRDWFLRRLLALTDLASVTAALALALLLLGGTSRHPWQTQLLYGLATLPAWVVLFKMYGLYERDAKRLSHSTLDDLPLRLVKHRVGRVVVAAVELERRQLLQVLHECKTFAVKVSLLPSTFSALGPSVEVDDLQGVTVLGVNPPVLSRSSWLVKRT